MSLFTLGLVLLYKIEEIIKTNIENISIEKSKPLSSAEYLKEMLKFIRPKTNDIIEIIQK